jgi:hypothetical protein
MIATVILPQLRTRMEAGAAKVVIPPEYAIGNRRPGRQSRD